MPSDRVTPDELQRIREAAEAAGESASDVATGRFLNRCDPATVLRLVEEIERLRGSQTDPRALFGARVRRRREAAGLGLRELARRIGVDPGYLSRLERGEKSSPGEAVIVSLDAVLGGLSDIVAAARMTPDEVAGVVRALDEARADIGRLHRDLRIQQAKAEMSCEEPCGACCACDLAASVEGDPERLSATPGG